MYSQRALSCSKALCFGQSGLWENLLAFFTMNYLNKPRIHFEMAYLNETYALIGLTLFFCWDSSGTMCMEVHWTS
jgi:hypothetical protein